MVDWDRTVRKSGSINQREDDAEAARQGRARTPDDIPKQDAYTRDGYVKGNVNPNSFVPTPDETGQPYRLGAPVRPNIGHDDGFSKMKKRAPTASDYVALAKWKAMLNGAEALRPDLSDACAAYRHYLEGNGAKRQLSYERYVMSDLSGQATLRNAILDFQNAAIELAQANKLKKFNITGPAIPCGTNEPGMQYIAWAFPYPATENWQKAIGGHFIWLSGSVEITTSNPMLPEVYRATMDLHAEDWYNFNPGNDDIATGISDNENGIFEVTGLARAYANYGLLRRLLQWNGSELGVQLSSRPHTTRLRQPTNNVRLRNRI